MRLIGLMVVFLFSAQAYAQEKLHVVASFSILGDMVKQVAGDAVELTTLVGPDADTHAYSPSPADARELARADLVITNGLGLEGWLERLAVASGKKANIVAVTDGVHALQLEENPAEIDPHAWQSLSNGKIYVKNIRNALTAADPAHEALYRANAARYLNELDKLESWVKAEIDAIPPHQRNVISTHDAFRYLGEEYKVKFLAPLGISTESQASAADIAKLIDQVRTIHIRAVFLENMTDSRLIRQLEKDADAYVGGMLYSDSLSRPDGPAASYVALFRHNVSVLAEGMRRNPVQ